MKLSEMNLAAGKSRPLRKELTCRETQKTVPKSVKRQSKINSCLEESTNEFSPRKRLKLSTSDTIAHSIENDLSVDGCLNKQMDSSFSESVDMTDSPASAPTLIKGTKPIQALLAKNIGNKVTLTSQLPPTVGRSISTSEKLIMSTVGTSPIKPVLPSQTSSKNPLQVLYKMSGGHCVPIDLHNNSVKIQVQPVADGKPGEKTTGEKIMQQVLILPKNFLIHHRDSKSGAKEVSSLGQKTTEQQCISLPQPTFVNTTLAPILPASSVNAAATFLPSTNFKKNTTHLTQGPDAGSRFSALPSVTPTGNLLTSVVKMSQSEATKTKTVVSAASSPVASPTVSSAVQTLPPPLPQSVSACTSNSSPRLASPQKSADVSEAKQELKTVCIRDSQSILVTTRGGNTGIVKVQTNSDQISPNNLAPNSVFTYAPQLQAFLVPKSTQLSNTSAVTTAIPSFPALIQSPPTTTASITSLPVSVNQAVGKNMTVAFGQPLNSGTKGHGLQKTIHVSSPTFLPPMSSKIVMPPPPPPSSSANTISISSGNIGQNTACTTQTPLMNQQVSINCTKYSVTQTESVPITSGNVVSGAQIQKLMLVTNPPLLPACGTAGVNLIPSSTCTGATAQKVVFINTPLANIQSNSTLTAESFKQTFPPSVGKTYVKSAEQPQLVLIPSTVGNSIKVNTSPTVSQIKDVKIGLNIGQAIINSTGSIHNVPPINILQPVASKDAEEKNSQGVILPLPTCGALVPVCSNLSCQSFASIKESPNTTTRAGNVSTVTTNVCFEPTSVALSGPTTGARPSVLAGGIDTSTKITPVVNTRLRASNVGNAMAISTVKTGHLASSVLISTTQPAPCHSNLTSSFQLPVTLTLPVPMNGSPQMMHTVPQLPAVPPAAQCMPLSKSQQSTLVQFQSPGIAAAVPINGSVQKPQTALPPNTSNTGKVISVPNVAPLPCQLLPPSFVKPVPVFTCAPGASPSQAVAVSPPVGSNIGGQLNESCIQQKIIINTCTPLAPGTQIMISGTRFIVPPQGLGAGSHVLLISTNPKLGPLLTVSNGHGFQGVSHAAPSPQQTGQVSSNALSWQPSKQPLKSFTKIVNSLGTTNPLPVVHPTPQIVNSATKPSTPPFATTLFTSVNPSISVAKMSSVGGTHTSNSQLQGNASVLHLDTSIKKLMVSPEGAILNAIKTPTSKTSSSFSPDIVSTSKSTAAVFPNFLNSSIGVPDTAAS